LIPILSFLFLRGRCSYCKKKISFQYPLIELGTGFLFLLVSSPHGLLNNTYLLLVASLLIIIFIYDLKHYIIPDKVIYLLIIIAFIYQLFFGCCLLLAVSSAFLASGFFVAIVIFSKGKAMGLGDVKLVFFMGLFLGFPDILTA